MVNSSISSGMVGVIQDMCSRHTTPYVANELDLGVNTIRKYNSGLMSKFRTGLVRLNKPKFRIFDPDTAVDETDYKEALVQAKFDGMRIEITKYGKEVEFFSEDKLIEKTEKLKIQAEEIAKLQPRDLVLDAEALWFHEKDKPGFRTDITGYLNSKDTDKDDNVILFIFDIMRYNDQDLTKFDLRSRLEFLDKLTSSNHVKILNRNKLMGFIVKSKDFESAITKVTKLPASEGAMIKDISSNYLKDSTQNPGWTKYKKLSEVDVKVLKKDPVEDSPGVFNFYTGIGPISKETAQKIGPKRSWQLGNEYYMYLGKTFNSKLPASVGDIIRVEGQILREEADNIFAYSIFTPRVIEEVPEKKRSDTPDVLENLFRAQKLPPKRKLTDKDKSKEIEKLKDYIETGQKPIIKAKNISEADYEKYSKERGPLPDRFYEKSLHAKGWAQFHIRGITDKEKKDFEDGKLSLERLIRANSVHLDLRIKSEDKLIQWVLPGDPKENLAKLKRSILGQDDPETKQTQKIRAIVKPSAEAAREEPTQLPSRKLFRAALQNSFDYADRMPSHLFMKEDTWGIKQGSFWIPPGEVGANPDTWSYLLLVDRIDVDGGVQRRDMHEYWIQGKHFNGRYVFRAQKQEKPAEDEGLTPVFWQMIKTDEEIPLNPKEHNDQGELFPIFETKVRRAEIKKSDDSSDLEVALEQIGRQEFAKVNQLEPKSGSVLKLDDVFKALPKQPICLKQNFIMLTGGIANRGETTGDIDILIRCSKNNDEFNIPAMFRALRGIEDDKMRKEFAERAEWCYKDSILRPDGKAEDLADYGGPFTNYVPLYDLYAIPRRKADLIKMMVEKSGKTLFTISGTCGPILKSSNVTPEKGDIYVAGYASGPIIDRQGDQIPLNVLKPAFNTYFEDENMRYANINALHSSFTAGTLIKELKTPQGILRNKIDDEGLFVVGKLREGKTPMLRKVRKKVLQKKLNSFSLGGWFHDKRLVCNNSGVCANRVLDMELWEITLCYRGANQKGDGFKVFTM